MIPKRGKFERLDASVPIELRFLGETHSVLCDNIGGKGFRFSQNQKIEANTSLELTLYLPDEKPPFRAKGRVSWVRPQKTADEEMTLFEIGVEFLEVKFQDRERIRQYVYRRLQRQKPPEGA